MGRGSNNKKDKGYLKIFTAVCSFLISEDISVTKSGSLVRIFLTRPRTKTSIFF